MVSEEDRQVAEFARNLIAWAAYIGANDTLVQDIWEHGKIDRSKE